MAQEKRRFAFDDEDENDEVEIIEEEVIIPSEPIKEEVLEDSSMDEKIEIEEPRGEETLKKKKRKFKLKIWHIVLLVFVLIVGIFFTYIFASTSNDGPVYGDRCAVLVEVDETKFNEVAQQMIAVDGIQFVEIKKDCRIIDILIAYDDYVGAADAQELARQTLQTLDLALGQEKENEEDPYSKVFGFANGRGQYNVNFRLRSIGASPEFPMFGTKQPKEGDIVFTMSTPANQETTDKVNGTADQKAAENATQE